MPDGDKFERRLRGKGWAKAYRLSCSNDSLNPIVDQLMAACASSLRNGLQDSDTLLQKVGKALCEALRLESQAKRTGLTSYKDMAFLHLDRNLDDLIEAGAN